MRKISSAIMACAMCLSMTVVGVVTPKAVVQAEVTAQAELKEAPTETPSYEKNFGYDCQLKYKEDVSEWLSAIEKVEVNGVEYTKGSSFYSVWNNTNYYVDVKQNYVFFGEKEFNEDTSVINKVVISAEGYKNLILEVNEKDTTVAIHTIHTGGTATCIQKAVCDFCGEEYGDLAEHTYGDTYESDGTYHWKKCQICDATTEKEAHKGGRATTTKKAVCDVCGAEYGDLKRKDPKPADKTTGTKNDTKPAATTTVKNNTKPAKKNVKAKKIIVNKKSIALKKGKKVTIKVKLKPVNATEKVTFKSSNKKIAKVTNKGIVKAIKKGRCKITVKTASGKKIVVKVTVK